MKICTKTYLHYYQHGCSAKCLKNIGMCVMDIDLSPSFYHMGAVFHIKQMILAEEEGVIECHVIEINIFL